LDEESMDEKWSHWNCVHPPPSSSSYRFFFVFVFAISESFVLLLFSAHGSSALLKTGIEARGGVLHNWCYHSSHLTIPGSHVHRQTTNYRLCLVAYKMVVYKFGCCRTGSA
jgi:hypothetical protein